MRRVFEYGGDVEQFMLELEKTLAHQLHLQALDSGSREQESPQCQLIAAVESRAFPNLLHGAHPLRLIHCQDHPDDAMQYSFSFPIEIQGLTAPSAFSSQAPFKTARLPSVQMLLGVSEHKASVFFAPDRYVGSDDVAFDAGTPKQTPRRFFMLPPLEVGLSPERPSSKLAKPRRQLSLQDLLCADAATDATLVRRGKANHRRQCGVPDCYKYALTGGFCIRHGGGKRCSHSGCMTVAQSGGRCKAHGGGSKCKMPNCGSVARRRGYCMAHGGRQQCRVAGCTKCAHGGGYCISHGGGKRCSSVTCTKSAQAGGFCYSHGGGKRCSAPECFQAARKGGLCIRHRKANEPPLQQGTIPF